MMTYPRILRMALEGYALSDSTIDRVLVQPHLPVGLCGLSEHHAPDVLVVQERTFVCLQSTFSGLRVRCELWVVSRKEKDF